MSDYLSQVFNVSTEAEQSQNDEALVATGGFAAPAEVFHGDYEKVGGKRPLKLAKRTELEIRKKIVSHNAKPGTTGLTASVDMVRSVYRRGAGEFAALGKPDSEREAWALKRVDAFLTMLAAGAPAVSAYVDDFDLLPEGHPASTRALTASAPASYEEELSVELLPTSDDYESNEHAIYTLAEFSGLGYEVIPAIRASWIRGLKNNENPYERAAVLASALYDSQDADLLPKKGIL